MWSKCRRQRSVQANSRAESRRLKRNTKRKGVGFFLKPCETHEIDENKGKDETIKNGEEDEKKEKDEGKNKAVNDDDKKNEAKDHTEQDAQSPRTWTLEQIIGSRVIPVPVVKPSWDDREIGIWTASYTAHGFRWPVGSKNKSEHLVASLQRWNLGNTWLPDIVHDCSAFTCDLATYSRHTDEHPDVIGSIVMNPDFDASMKQFANAFNRCLCGKGDDLKVLLFCPRGTKRSVAVARILAHTFTNYGYKVVGPNNLDIDCNRHRVNCPTCFDWEWLLDSQERLSLLNYAANKITQILKNEVQMPTTPP